MVRDTTDIWVKAPWNGWYQSHFVVPISISWDPVRGMYSSIDSYNVQRPYRQRSILYPILLTPLFLGTSSFPPALESNPAVPRGYIPSRWLGIVWCQHRKRLMETMEGNRWQRIQFRGLAYWPCTSQNVKLIYEKTELWNSYYVQFPPMLPISTEWSLQSSGLRSLLQLLRSFLHQLHHMLTTFHQGECSIFLARLSRGNGVWW